MSEIYDSRREAEGGTFAVGDSANFWRSKEDKDRFRLYEENWNLFLGKHYVGDGGPWKHPYGMKGIEENIPYQMLNLLGKNSRVFADLLYGDGIEIKSTQYPEFFASIDTKQMWTAFILASVFGFCGLQPQKEEGKWSVSTIKPEFLFLEFCPSNPNKVNKIYKRVPYLKVQTQNGQIDVLFEETHFKNKVETRIWEIKGDSKVRELPFDFYKEYIDESFDGLPYWVHNLGCFFITLLFNEKISNTIVADYTNAAKRGQESLNDQKTQIARILKLHSNPKILAPRSAFTQDSETGQWVWANENSEVIMSDPNDPNSYRYLTWDSNIAAAVESRDDMILSLCTELDLAPQLLSMPRLVGGSVAETSAKLKQLMHATIKKAERKREWAWLSLEKCVKNIARLSGMMVNEDSFTICFSDFIPRTREEKLDEAIARKSSGLISVKDAIRLIDSSSEEEAENIAQEINIENTHSTPSPFRLSESDVPAKYFPQAPAMESEQ